MLCKRKYPHCENGETCLEEKKLCQSMVAKKIDGKITLNIIGISTSKTKNYMKSKITNYCEELDIHMHIKSSI